MCTSKSANAEKGVKMNITNYGTANYQMSFQSGNTPAKAAKMGSNTIRTTRLFREGESLEQILARKKAEKRAAELAQKYISTPMPKIPLTCSDGREASALAAALDMVIKNLEKHVEENPNDIEARAQLSKIKEALKIEV